MVYKTAEWRWDCVLNEGGADGTDDGNFFLQLEPNGWLFDAKQTH
jgi:hypothetical protein